MVMPKKGDASEVAMLRFSLIAPVVNGTYTQPSKAAYFRDVSERPVTLPDGTVRYFNPNTLATWESRYRRLGFDGLVRSGRSDAGTSRRIGPEVAAAIRALREAHPRISRARTPTPRTITLSNATKACSAICSSTILYLLETATWPEESGTSMLGFRTYSLEHLMPKKWRNHWSPWARKTARDATGRCSPWGTWR